MNERDPYDDNRQNWAQIATVLIGVTLIVAAFVLMVTMPEQIEAVASGLTRSSTSQFLQPSQLPPPPTIAPTAEPLVAQLVPFVPTIEPERVRTDVVRVPQATAMPEPDETGVRVEEIGRSVEDRAIERHSFGDGEQQMTFVGGIHGGYEWNTVALAYRMIRYFEDNPAAIPPSLTIHIIPAFNPDGVFATLGQEGEIDIPSPSDLKLVSFKQGRFNGNRVDLNRNWDCGWQQDTLWVYGTVPMGGGTEPFSEPETRALKAHFEEGEHVAAVFWHSFANAVYPGMCGEPFEASVHLTQVYAEAANYFAKTVFESYTVTGTAGGWLATINIPTIAVELETQESIEWERNLAGTLAIINDHTPSP